MNYELAKELKDAGFPFDFGNATVLDVFPSYTSFDRTPNLEELIEACGNEFTNLSRTFLKDGTTTDSKEKWAALGMSIPDSYGITPKEAVARLWLALKKK